MILLTVALAAVPSAAQAQAKPNAPQATTILSLTRDFVNEPRVNLDLEDQPLREALKQLFERAKQSYKVDDDVPNTARITVRAKNVRLSTALELLLQDAGVGIARQVEDGRLLYRIRKSGPDTLSTTDLLRSVVDAKVDMSLLNPQQLKQFRYIDPHAKGPVIVDPKQLELHLRALPGAPFGGGPNSPAIPYVYTMREQRSLFRCPHCKGQATVLRQQEQPKCDKCARPFQAGWQFCPADGAKRPASSGEWKYCPFCSKKVEGEKGAGIPFLEDLPLVGDLFRFTPATPAAVIPPVARPVDPTAPAAPPTPSQAPGAPAAPPSASH
jgi:hypothetical protein